MTDQSTNSSPHPPESQSRLSLFRDKLNHRVKLAGQLALPPDQQDADEQETELERFNRIMDTPSAWE